MAKIKFTKSELKKQRDALKQFTRFLPTLQLKKQQLQMEMRKCQARLRGNEAAEREIRGELENWLALFGPENTIDKITGLISLKGVEAETVNIAGVKVPVFKEIDIEIAAYDLFIEDPWIDDAIAMIEKVLSLRAEHRIIEEQYRLIGQELRTTSQRVNLFEKVKIPECRDNIRSIQIYLGDQDTAAVGRSKIAKKKLQETAA